MLCKCKECGTLFERSENAVKHRPDVLCRSCTVKLANLHRDKKAIYEKVKNTCLERYGVTNPSKLGSVKEKKKETCLKKYGVSSPLCLDENKQTIDFKKRGQTIKETMIERYGGCTYSSNELNCKAQQTCIERYGNNTFAASGELRKRREEILIDKYGSLKDAYIHIMEKGKETNIERYGFENTWMLASKSSILYDGIYFDSTPEVEFYKFFTEKGYTVKFEPTYFEYFIGNEKHRYFPDFEVNGVYYEIKGDHLLNENDQLIDFFGDKHILVEKTQCIIDHNVRLIRVSELQKFFDNFKSST